MPGTTGRSVTHLYLQLAEGGPRRQDRGIARVAAPRPADVGEVAKGVHRSPDRCGDSQY